MKKTLFIILLNIFNLKGNAQEPKKIDVLKEVANLSCECIEKIDIYDKTPQFISSEISECIDKHNTTYQFLSKATNLDKKTKENNIVIATDKNSNDYKNSYYEMERYLVNNCDALKQKIAAFDKKNNKSISNNPRALEYYQKGNDEGEKNNLKKALKNYKKAVEIDPEFAFAWDNLGLTYRKLNDFDNAIASYEESLKIDPNGFMPLQNIAIAYQYKKEYKKAIKSYERLAELDDQNPEIYYGMGQVYAGYLQDYEKGLDNICKAYNLYVKLKSPYRTDAEKIINIIYAEMKKESKEKQFNAILKKHNISY